MVFVVSNKVKLFFNVPQKPSLWRPWEKKITSHLSYGIKAQAVATVFNKLVWKKFKKNARIFLFQKEAQWRRQKYFWNKKHRRRSRFFARMRKCLIFKKRALKWRWLFFKRKFFVTTKVNTWERAKKKLKRSLNNPNTFVKKKISSCSVLSVCFRRFIPFFCFYPKKDKKRFYQFFPQRVRQRFFTFSFADRFFELAIMLRSFVGVPKTVLKGAFFYPGQLKGSRYQKGWASHFKKKKTKTDDAVRRKRINFFFYRTSIQEENKWIIFALGKVVQKRTPRRQVTKKENFFVKKNKKKKRNSMEEEKFIEVKQPQKTRHGAKIKERFFRALEKSILWAHPFGGLLRIRTLRASWKSPFIPFRWGLIRPIKVEEAREKVRDFENGKNFERVVTIKSLKRSQVIVPAICFQKTQVHQGKKWEDLPEGKIGMEGYAVGEFCSTRSGFVAKRQNQTKLLYRLNRKKGWKKKVKSKQKKSTCAFFLY